MLLEETFGLWFKDKCECPKVFELLSSLQRAEAEKGKPAKVSAVEAVLQKNQSKELSTTMTTTTSSVDKPAPSTIRKAGPAVDQNKRNAGPKVRNVFAVVIFVFRR